MEVGEYFALLGQRILLPVLLTEDFDEPFESIANVDHVCNRRSGIFPCEKLYFCQFTQLFTHVFCMSLSGVQQWASREQCKCV